MIHRLLTAGLSLLFTLGVSAAPTYTVYEVEVTAESDVSGAVTDVEFTFLAPGAALVAPTGDAVTVNRETDGGTDSKQNYAITRERSNKLICTAQDGAIGGDGDEQTDTFRMVVRDQQVPKLIVTTRTESGEVSTVILRALDEEIQNSQGHTISLTLVVDEADIGQYD